MLFNSFEYVLFLILAFAAYWSLARMRVLRTTWLLLASYVFYMSWNATFVLLIIASTIIDYWIGRRLEQTDVASARKFLLGISVSLNLGLLGLFKYADFFIEAAAEGLGRIGWPVEPRFLNLVLPVGISFYTFQTLSYTIDIYRRRLRATKSFLEFATFVAFFPQLVAGPIVRAREFLPQFKHPPRLSAQRVSEGLFLILCGMIKKVAIADFLATRLIDRVFENPESFSSAEVWVAVYGYTWQLYGDFSGYTDIARGSAKLFGFELPKNFDRPFNTTGPIEFWKRWHITLSTWVQDYVYISLGGSKKGEARTYFNLFLTFFIIGVWHGAGWTFVIFGLWHAMGVTLNRAYRQWRGRERPAAGWPRWVATLVSVHFFVIHWPMFRSPTVERMFEVYRQMFAFSGASLRIDPWVGIVIVGMFVVHFTPKAWVGRAERAMTQLSVPLQAALIAAIGALLMYIGSEQAAPFIYFQF